MDGMQINDRRLQPEQILRIEPATDIHVLREQRRAVRHDRVAADDDKLNALVE